MTATLPPLPEPDTHCWDEDTQRDCWSHSPEQVRAYGAACAAAEREACAQECGLTADDIRGQGEGAGDGRYEWMADGAMLCADAIRARKDTE